MTPDAITVTYTIILLVKVYNIISRLAIYVIINFRNKLQYSLVFGDFDGCEICIQRQPGKRGKKLLCNFTAYLATWQPPPPPPTYIQPDIASLHFMASTVLEFILCIEMYELCLRFTTAQLVHCLKENVFTFHLYMWCYRDQ